MASDWTPERTNLVKNLWADGFSASHIASRLGGVTRNAVIGKIARMKMVRSPATIATAHAAAVKVRHVSPVPKPKVAVSGSDLVKKHAGPSNPDPAVVAPLTRRVDIMALQPGVCHWPLGDPLKPDFDYCGALCRRTSRYCGPHHAVAYTTTPREAP